MAKLQVTISRRLAEEFLELMRHTYEASDVEMDEELDNDLSAFSRSFRKAVQRKQRREGVQAIIKRHRRDQ